MPRGMSGVQAGAGCRAHLGLWRGGGGGGVVGGLGPRAGREGGGGPGAGQGTLLLGWDPPLACASLKCPDSDPQACSLSVSLNLAVKEKKKAEG